MSDKKRYFVRSDTKIKIKSKFKKDADSGKITEEELYNDFKKYHEQYTDFSIDTFNEHGVMYTVESGFSSQDEAKDYVMKVLRKEENSNEQ